MIPFYQNQPGLLHRAVQSILNQAGVQPYQIVIVDDGSPVPATLELRELIPAVTARGIRLDIHTVSNGGVSSARNHGLDHLDERIEFVAFLDSDDCWKPAHLKRATTALRRTSSDFYFANFMSHKQGDFFARIGFDPIARFGPDLGDGFHQGPEDVLTVLLDIVPICTSSVMYRRAPYQAHRFPVSLRLAGEDHLFWMRLAASGAPFVCSSQIEFIYGYGVSIHSGAAWGTRRMLSPIPDQLLLRRTVLSDLPLTMKQRAIAAVAQDNVRQHFVVGLLHSLRHHGMAADWRSIIRCFKNDPRVLLQLPSRTARAIQDHLVVRD